MPLIDYSLLSFYRDIKVFNFQLMKNLKLFLSLLFSGILFSASSQSIPEIKADELLNRINNGGDTTFVINFWSTWCAPCVKELPLFEEINTNYSNQNVKVLLVSVDFKKDIQNKLKTFIDKKHLKSEVLFLDEKDPNEWISKFTDKWEGVIPATMVFNSTKSINTFKSSAFEKDELMKFLKKWKVIED